MQKQCTIHTVAYILRLFLSVNSPLQLGLFYWSVMFPLNSSSGQNPVRGRILGYRMETGHQEREEGEERGGRLGK